MPPLTPKALVFDVFGTCVDWRGSIIAEGRTLDARWGIRVDWPALADAWRGRYQPALDEVRSGRRSWTILDVLHRESLDALAPSFGLDKLDAAARDHLTRVLHRPREFGDQAKADLPSDPKVDLVVNDFEGLATKLGC